MLGRILGLEYAQAMNFINIVIESDSCFVISKFFHDTLDFTHLGQFVSKARILYSNFDSLDFHFVNRAGNNVADRSIRMGLLYVHKKCFGVNCPHRLHDLIIANTL